MAGRDKTAALDHVVVLMFENRSFDNVLGCLYEPGEVASFEGVLGKDLSNPIPPWAEHGAERKAVDYGVAGDMTRPTRTPVRSTSTSTPSCSGSWTPTPTGVCQPRRWSRRSTRHVRDSGRRWTASSPTTSVPSPRRWKPRLPHSPPSAMALSSPSGSDTPGIA